MKIILTAFLNFFLLNVFAQIPANGLIAHFPFTNNANDASGNGNNGIVTGASLIDDRFGNANCAYYFPNSNDNISIPTITQTNVLTYSISGWFKKNSTSINNEGTVFSGSNPLITPGLRFHIGSDNQAAWGVETDNGSVWSYSQNQNYADDNWHFFTIIFNANLGVVDSSELITYIDNVEIPKIQQVWGNQNAVLAPVNNQNLPTIIGNEINGNDNFDGVLDDIRIYDRVLTPTEISYIYYESPCTNTITTYDTVLVTVTDTLVINAQLTGMLPPNNSNTIKIFPNPTNDLITINYGNYLMMNGYTLKITNSLSQTVFTTSINQQQSIVDLSAWSGNGLYFVHVIDAANNTIDIRKIVLQ